MTTQNNAIPSSRLENENFITTTAIVAEQNKGYLRADILYFLISDSYDGKENNIFFNFVIFFSCVIPVLIVYYSKCMIVYDYAAQAKNT